jgi:RNA polymerase sporulation-specific sigma factor
MGEIRRFLRDDGMVKVSRSMKEKGYLISNARKELTDMLGREPELKELAEKTGLSEEEIVLAVEANGEVESIYQSVYQSDGSEIYLLDRLKDKKNAQEELENKLLIEELLQQLSGREQQLIKMRYFENATQSQIAARLGTSQVQVSRMEKKILLQMRKYMSQG